ncbi:dihydrolipoyllysine-residue acetyltransferase component 2 of pyruvate dehydrogenase complex, mitochondrial [Physcomitrium patens]|uniref:dihydrolipoyllysine-residue acetyltransferase component 2 of pyruvate dehydrogenase complex, mitochondrial n=1 Tax=Physcomitrium patens TaxID=3218 RepID=UPI003CCCB199
MEDGFLGKNVVCKNTNNIPCGQVICLMIDTEDQLETIGDYKVAVEGSSAPSQQSAPAAVPSPTPAPHSTASKPSTALPHQPDGGFQCYCLLGYFFFYRCITKDLQVAICALVLTFVFKCAAKHSLPRRFMKGEISRGRVFVEDVEYRDIHILKSARFARHDSYEDVVKFTDSYEVFSSIELWEEINRNLEANEKQDAPVKKVSLNDFVIKLSLITSSSLSQSSNILELRSRFPMNLDMHAAALASKKEAQENSSWTGEIRDITVDNCFAVQNEHGLIVPDADKKDLSAITDDMVLAKN